jgi:protein disulfide-isomerase
MVEHRVEIEWKSFQLTSFVASEDDDMVEHLATKYQKTKWAHEMMDSMTQNAKIQVDFHFEKRLWPIHLMPIAYYLAKET